MNCSTSGLPAHHQQLESPKRISVESVCHPTISSSVVPFSSCSLSLPGSGSFPVSQLFTSGGQSIWSFSFNISPSNEHPGLISFRMDGLDLLAVQGTLKNLLQHHSSEASILKRSTSFIVQLSHPYMTTGETIALTRWTFVGKVRSLLFNMLSRLIIAFLPKSKHLLISWLQSPSAVIFGAQKNKVSHCFHCFPIYFPWSDGTGYWSLFSECWALSQLFHSHLSLSSKRFFGSSSLSAIRVVSSG